MKKISILGSTGSIGTQALDVIAHNQDKFKVTALSCAKSLPLLCRQIDARGERGQDEGAGQDRASYGNAGDDL